MKLKIQKPLDLSNNESSNWLIKDLLPANSLSLLSAPPKHGKSMIALDIMTSLASGVDALGKYPVIQKGTCLYVALEDAPNIIRGRLEGFAKAKDISLNNLDLHVITEQVLRVDTDEGRVALEQGINQLKPSLVVLDNLARIHTSDENSAKAMGVIFEYFMHIKRKYNLTLMIICHSGKDSKIRGSSQIDSYYESGIFLSTKGDHTVMDLMFRGFESTKGIPYRVASKDGALMVLTGDSKPEILIPEKAKANHAVYSVNELLERGELIEVYPNVVTWSKQ